MTTRKKYTKEFKLNAISLVLEQNYTRIEAAKNLGIHTSILAHWIKESLYDEGRAFRGHVIPPKKRSSYK